MEWFRNITTAIRPETVGALYLRRPDVTSTLSRLIVAHENAVIMGRRTWQSLPGIALPGRRNIVLSRDRAWRAALPVDAAATFSDALDRAEEQGCHNVFVIGGGQVYTEALQFPAVRTMFITQIDEEFPEADTWFPAIDPSWKCEMMAPWLVQEGVRFRFTLWRRT